MTRVIVGEREHGARADVVVARALGMSVRSARELFERRAVRANGKLVAKGVVVAKGDVLLVEDPHEWLKPEEAGWLVVVHEDARVVVVDKPAGVACHPLERGEGGTLADALAARFPEVARAAAHEREAGLAHRLDTGTSGLVAAARTRAVWTELRRAFSEGNVARKYLALVDGRLASGGLVLDGPIAHDARDKRKMVVVGRDARPRGEPQPARTAVRVIAAAERASLVVALAEGGRRHQVRVHLAGVGHPLVGDELYGGSRAEGRAGHMLHAALLGLPGMAALTSRPGDDFARVCRERGLEGAALDDAVAALRLTDAFS